MDRIYISGKIGEEVISDATRQKFAKAERALGEHFNLDFCEIINPASEALQEAMDVDFRWRQIPKNLPDILLYDLQWLRTCDTICLLHDWGSHPVPVRNLPSPRPTGIRVYEMSQYGELAIWEPKKKK